jgi:phage host-nuclease inhibitor protein Gam
MPREKKTTLFGATRAEAEDAMQHFAKANSRLKFLESKIEQEKQRIDDKYKDEILALQQQKQQYMEVLEVFAKADAQNWSGKSIDLLAGTIGFRTGTPKVEKNKKFTWPAITELLQQYFPTLVRTKHEPDKEAIIALREDPEFEQLKKLCHIDVVQEESFYVVPKEEELTQV